MIIKSLFYFCFIVTLCNCKSQNRNNKSFKTPNSSQRNKFFEYDQVDYYSTQYSEIRIPELIHNKTPSVDDSLKKALILRNTPQSLSDTFFISKLKALNYKHREIPKDKFSLLDSIFVEKPEVDYTMCASERVFTEILVFKNRSRISGIVKFSYGCTHNFYFLGTKANTNTFGQDEEYNKLSKLRP